MKAIYSLLQAFLRRAKRPCVIDLGHTIRRMPNVLFECCWRDLRTELLDPVDVRETAVVRAHLAGQASFLPDSSPGRVNQCLHPRLVLGRLGPQQVIVAKAHDHRLQEPFESVAHHSRPNLVALWKTNRLGALRVELHRPINEDQPFLHPQLAASQCHLLTESKSRQKEHSEHRASGLIEFP